MKYNKSNRIILFVAFMFYALFLIGQEKYKIKLSFKGMNGNNLDSVYVNLIDFNQYFYNDTDITLAKGMYHFVAFKKDYKSKSDSFFVGSDNRFSFELNSAIDLKEISIFATREERTVVQHADGSYSIGRGAIHSIPEIFGQADPIRNIQNLPGIQSGNEGTQGLFVRGGSPDQNYFTIEGAPIYNPFHFFGLLSILQSDVVKRMEVHKDVLPAEFGERLGVYIPVSIDEGNSEKIKGYFGFGVTTISVGANGPIGKKKKSQFLFSTRICPLGWIIKPISAKMMAKQNVRGGMSYLFGDIHVKLKYRITDKTDVWIHSFTNRDYFSYARSSNENLDFITVKTEYEQQMNWSNITASFGLNHIISPIVNYKASLAYSRYELGIVNQLLNNQTDTQFPDVQQMETYNLNSKSYTQQLTFKSIFCYDRRKIKSEFGFGINYLNYVIGKGALKVEDQKYKLSTGLFGKEYNPLELFVFFSHNWKPIKPLRIQPSFHLRHYQTGKLKLPSFSPRLHLCYEPINKLFIRATTSYMTQNSHLLVAESASFINDYWVPATAKAKPETVWNFSAGVTQHLPLNFVWSIDGYYRIFKNLIDYDKGISNTFISQAWEQQIEVNGKGRSYGVELALTRTNGKITGNVAYTLAWSKRQFSSINEGKEYPYKYDRRHNFSAQLMYKIGYFEISAMWVYGSGNMITKPNAVYQSYGAIRNFEELIRTSSGNPLYTSEFIFVYEGKNNYRLPAYHHLDISFSFKKTIGKFQHHFNLSVYNVYNRANIYMIYPYYRPDIGNRSKIAYKQLSLLPILPSVSYTIHF